MRKFKDNLLFIIDGKIWGSHLVGHPDERKGLSEETHCLLGIREQSGGAWWLEKLTSRRSGYICPL
jgi:hypothetical protein